MATTKTIAREPINPKLAKTLVLSAIALTVVDMVYANINGIHMLNRDTLCILATSLPRWAFLAYEHLLELAVVVLLGVFAGVIVEAYIFKMKRFLPKNQMTAFLYGAFLPICSCGAIPLVETMKQRVSLRVIVTFLIAAPILNPYIIVLSISVMGINYALIRIASSLVLAISLGILVQWLGQKYLSNELGKYELCDVDCKTTSTDPFVKTLLMTKKLLPYILIGGLLSFGLELFNPKQFLSTFNFSNPWLSIAIMLVIGIPLYVCNGADILLLKPLMTYTDLTLGSAMVFSLTASAVCVSSIVMLSKFLGTKLTALLIACLTVVTVIIGAGLNWVM